MARRPKAAMDDLAVSKAGPKKASPIASVDKPRSLTLRLTEADYQRLRRHAFDNETSHQAVIEAAVLDVLDRG
jgi:hypothetical protein